MLPIEILHKFANILPPYKLFVYVVILSSILTLIIGFMKNKLAFSKHMPGVIYLLLCAVLFVIPKVSNTTRIIIITLAGISLAVNLIINRKVKEEPNNEKKTKLTSWIYLGVILFISFLILFNHLGSFAGTMLVWESPVSQEFSKAFVQGTGIFKYALGCLLWDNGLMSSGDRSFFYGAPTYAALKIFGFNLWSLRVVSVLLTLISIWIIFILGNKFFGKCVGAAGAVLWALCPGVLFYGRYGTLSSGTFLAALLAIYCTWLFLDNKKPKWWIAPLCALSLYIATLQYSPARILVIILIGSIFAVSAIEWRSFSIRRGIGLVVIILSIICVWQVQKHYKVNKIFFHARGEQYFHFLKDRYFLKQYLNKDISPDKITRDDKVVLLLRVLDVTIPQYKWFMSPHSEFNYNGVLNHDPPNLPLYFGPILPFIIWGLCYSIFRWKSWRYATLIVWFVLASGPILLTNRVDAHRISIFFIPVGIWAALGVCESIKIMKYAKVPFYIQHILAGLLVFSLFYMNTNVQFFTKTPNLDNYSGLKKELDLIEGPVIAAVQSDHREVSLTNMVLMERMRKDPSKPGKLVDESTRRSINDMDLKHREVSRGYIQKLENLRRSNTILLIPFHKFKRAAEALKERGVPIELCGEKEFRMYKIKKGTDTIDYTDQEHSLTETGDNTSLFGNAPHIYLSKLKPLETSYGFEAPRFDLTWDNRMIKMNGVYYEHGIGVHGWTTIKYEVPENAVKLLSIIGLSDSILDCDAASVTFEITNEKKELLYKSCIIDVKTSPKLITVDLKGAKTITLDVTEGGDSRDCDHANWAEAAFILKEEK